MSFFVLCQTLSTRLQLFQKLSSIALFSSISTNIIIDPAGTLFEKSGLGGKYWLYVVEHVVYIRDGLPRSALRCTSYKKLTVSVPSLCHI